MLKPRRIAIAVTLFLLVSQTACVVESVNPLVEPEKCSIDDQLIGAWQLVGKDRVEYWFIARPRDVKGRPDGLLVAHGTTLNANKDLNWLESPEYFFTVKVGESQYLQWVRPPNSQQLSEWRAADEKVFEFSQYQVAADRLTLWIMNRDAVAAAIKGGVLKGTVKETKTITSPKVTLTEPSEALRRFFASESCKSVFPDKGKITLKRVK